MTLRSISPLPLAFVLATAVEASAASSANYDLRSLTPGNLAPLIEGAAAQVTAPPEADENEQAAEHRQRVVQYFRNFPNFPNFPNFINCFVGTFRNC